MEKYKINFRPNDIEVLVEKGISILDAMIKAGLEPDAPCGGQGTCGKCMVKIISEEKETIVKACKTYIEKDMVVDTLVKNHNHFLLTTGIGREIQIDPIIKTLTVKVDKCVVGENSSEWERLKMAVERVSNTKCSQIPPNINVVSKLYKNLKIKNQLLNVVMCENEIIDIRIEDDSWYIVAFDIGTTSIVAYLLDGRTGEQICAESMLNPQSQFGADVITRANYAIENGVEKLSSVVRNGLNTLIEQVVQKGNISSEQIYLTCIVGNTCMSHMFLGIAPESLVHAPYNSTINEGLILNSRDYNMNINNNAKLMILPNIAGFLGSDTMGVLLATQFEKLEKLTLVIDIGTNGELAMGNRDKIIACSTAAGPAFEGAKIQCGMRGASGAIDSVDINSETLKYTTIDNEKPIGICGSGLIDAVAYLLNQGYIDDSGKLIDDGDRVEEIDNLKAFVFAYEDETQNQKKIFLNQRDIREVQLAKAAIAAGINLMAKELNININDIEQVLIAGAFGNYMSPKSACKIGLIPKELENKIISIGNAAGEGCKIAGINVAEFQKSKLLASNIQFLELAVDQDFQEYFIEELEF